MRTTSDKKDRVVRVRLSDEMYNKLIKKSTITNKTVSDIIRDSIKSYLK